MEENFNPYTNHSQKNDTPPYRQVVIKPNYFELFSFAFAVASLFSCSVIYMSYLFAGFAILFALLSRGGQMHFSPRAKKSLIMGICGIVLATFIFVGSLIYLLEEYGSLEGILRAGSEMMGIDFEEEFGMLFH